jgi:hypothetical protein
MRKLFGKKLLSARIAALLSSPAAMQTTLEDDGNAVLPDDLATTLAELRLLCGIPYNYLVPDERMLPPESIRFFHLDMDWVNALIDGAYSIGRNPVAGDDGALEVADASLATTFETTGGDGLHEWLAQRIGSRASDLPARQGGGPTLNLDRATLSGAKRALEWQSKQIRRRQLGYAETTFKPSENQFVSGFLLRSEVVNQYKGLVANCFAQGDAPDSDDMLNAKKMTILRMERLDEKSGILLCILDGDVDQVDITEAPEQLHFGLDGHLEKILQSYTKDPDTNVISLGNKKKPLPLNNKKYMREDASGSRTLNMENLATLIDDAVVEEGVSVDAAIFGFQMTQGVGLVRFKKG